MMFYYFMGTVLNGNYDSPMVGRGAKGVSLVAQFVKVLILRSR